MLIEDLGRVGGMRDVVRDPRFRHRVAGLAIHQWLTPVQLLAPQWFARQVNARLEELRQGAAAA